MFFPIHFCPTIWDEIIWVEIIQDEIIWVEIIRDEIIWVELLYESKLDEMKLYELQLYEFIYMYINFICSIWYLKYMNSFFQKLFISCYLSFVMFFKNIKKKITKTYYEIFNNSLISITPGPLCYRVIVYQYSIPLL